MLRIVKRFIHINLFILESIIFVSFLFLFFPTHAIAATCSGVENSPCGNSIGAVCCGAGYTCVQRTAGKGGSIQICSATANVNAGATAAQTGNINTANGIPVVSISIDPPPPPCLAKAPNGGCQTVDTAFGSWDTTPAGFVTSLFGILLSVSGGIAVLIIIFSGYKMIMSQGDPEKIQGARDQLTSAIIGLLFLVFSLVILQVIGVDVLHLPGFK